jgi:hypothetical protein
LAVQNHLVIIKTDTPLNPGRQADSIDQLLQVLSQAMPSLRIIYAGYPGYTGGKEVALKCQKDLSFNNFDQFVRQRFGFPDGVIVSYCTEDGEGKPDIDIIRCI